MEQFLKVFDESKIIASDIISSGVEIIKERDRMIQVKAPENFILQAVCVTEPGYKSILIAVNRFVTATIEASNKVEGSIHSKTLHYEPVKFDRNEDRIEISDVQAAKQLKYVVTAIEVFEQYVRSCNMNLKALSFNH